MRVDGEVKGVSLSFDNMYNRQITGSNDWTNMKSFWMFPIAVQILVMAF